MKRASINLDEFEKVVAVACMREAQKYIGLEPFRRGDDSAVHFGGKLKDIARDAGLSIPQTRRRMRALFLAGRAMRNETEGSWNRWWLPGLAPRPAQAVPAAAPAPAHRQPVTHVHQPAKRQHWADILGVSRDCSTSEAREAFKERLAAVNEHDIDAEAQRQRIRDAYNTRLTEDGISE